MDEEAAGVTKRVDYRDPTKVFAWTSRLLNTVLATHGLTLDRQAVPRALARHEPRRREHRQLRAAGAPRRRVRVAALLVVPPLCRGDGDGIGDRHLFLHDQRGRKQRGREGLAPTLRDRNFGNVLGQRRERRRDALVELGVRLSRGTRR